LGSEQVLAGLTGTLGKHAAQQLMHDVLAPGTRDVHQVFDTLLADGAVTEADRRAHEAGWAVGDAARMVDVVVARGRRAQAEESQTWV
jgi:adenylosuccinate lyase